MKALIRAGFLLFSSLLIGSAVAQHEGHEHATELEIENVFEEHSSDHEAHGTEKFNPGEMIMGHVGDEHGWHLWGHTSIPLPILVYNTERGFSNFSSSNFDHGHKTHGGYMLHEGKVVATDAPDGADAHHASVNEELTKSTWDISITKNVLGMFVSMAILLWVMLSVANGYKKRGVGAPKGLQSFIEPIIVFIRDDVAKANIGPKYERFMPYLLTVFFFILLNNLTGLIPIFHSARTLPEVSR